VNNRWRERRLEIITLGIFFILLLTSLLFLYNSYTNYTLLISSGEESKALVHQVIMFISTIILFFSLLIVYSKKDYFFVEEKHDTVALKNLFEEIKHSSNEDKNKQFKDMLKDENHTEIYTLISNMITELQESQKATEEANKIKTLFLSNMSHEIRTPITGIVGFTNFLSSSRLDMEQREFVDIIRKSSEDLLTVVNNILDISSLESGEIKLTKKPFNMVDEFEKLINIYAYDAIEKEIDFYVWIDPELNNISLRSDIEKIKQVVMNLISNAIKFTDKGGSVELSIYKKANLDDKNIDIEFIVKDSGIGIDKEHKKMVFKLFNQADSSNTRAYKGIGLGLTIANRIVKLMGGNLSLESEVGEGATFSFTLSIKEEKKLEKKDKDSFSIAIYAPEDIHSNKAYKHLVSYLSSNTKNSVTIFNSFVECKDAILDSFDILYIYYDDINVEELKRIVALYRLEKHIVLLTKISNRDKILDIAPIFTQVLYEPITLPKVELSLSHKKLVFPKEEDDFGLNVLIVEDNLINQKVIKHTLKGMGITSDLADNGEIGVEMFKKNRYDMVFMDIQMPVMNGVVATKKIIEYEERYNLDHTPIVAVTTNALKGDRELYLKSGMDEYIAKPISVDKFISVIKQFYAPKKELTIKEASVSRDILLYKRTPTEAKVLTSLLMGLDYAVDLAKSREEFYYKMKNKDYKLFLLDKNSADREDEVLMDEIINSKIPTLFLMGEKSVLSADDVNEHTKIMYEKSNFMVIHGQIEKMMKL
jgi:signal transduction histidine kinase/DNA-binding response OmpR family regulator